MNMHPSIYTLEWELADGKTLYYNVLRNKVVATHRPWRNLGEALIAQLVRTGILTPDTPEHEWRQCQSEVSGMRHRVDPVELMVVTNYTCNLRCVYCYQDRGAHVREDSLDSTMAARICDWLDSIAGAAEIRIVFTGGECLLNPGGILSFMRGLRKPVPFKIITNGTLLTEDLCSQLCAVGLSELMVSVDGPPHVHGRRRGDNYECIMRTIHIAQRYGVKVELHVKLDKDNADQVASLWTDLERRRFRRPIEITYGFIMNTEGCHQHCQRHACSAAEAGQLYRALWTSVFSRGMPFRFDIAPGTCPNERMGCVIVDPAGDIYKCTSAIGSEKGVRSNVADRPSLQSLQSDYPVITTHECAACVYYPICRGGCVYEATVLHQPRCKRPFYKDYLTVFRDFYQRMSVDPS